MSSNCFQRTGQNQKCSKRKGLASLKTKNVPPPPAPTRGALQLLETLCTVSCLSVTPAQVCCRPRGMCVFLRPTCPPPIPLTRLTAARRRCKTDYCFCIFKEKKQNHLRLFSIPCRGTQPVEENPRENVTRRVGTRQLTLDDDGSAELGTSGVWR